MIGQLDPAFDLTQPAGQVLAIIFFLIPGLNATWMIERLAGRVSLRPTERLLRAIALSVLVYALASPWLLRLGHRVTRHQGIWPWEPIAGLSLLLFVVPAIIGLTWAKVRLSGQFRDLVGRLTNIDPSPTSWDYVFAKGSPYMVRAKLRDGERVGGLFGPSSNASFYPEAQDLYLEQAWRLDNDGRFIDLVEGTRGLLIRRDDVEVLELLSVRSSEVNSSGEAN